MILSKRRCLMVAAGLLCFLAALLFFGLYYYYEDVQAPCHQDGDAKSSLCQLHHCSYDIDPTTLTCTGPDLPLEVAGAITGALAFSGLVLILLALYKSRNQSQERREWSLLLNE